jgi:hypothetical protein
VLVLIPAHYVSCPCFAVLNVTQSDADSVTLSAFRWSPSTDELSSLTNCKALRTGFGVHPMLYRSMLSTVSEFTGVALTSALNLVASARQF